MMAEPQAAGAEGAETGIAILAMDGCFPASPDLDSLWRNLRQGRECLTTFDRAELAATGIAPEMLDDPAYVATRGVLDDVELFDPELFGLGAREAELTDPQHRVFLECCWRVLERAAVDPRRFAGAIGVFAGSSVNDYDSALLPGAAGADRVQVRIGNKRDHLPMRVSYALDLRGPAVNVQTACSTSLVAVHLACQSLLTGECDLALAGGVSIKLPQVSGYLHHPGSIYSDDGHCRAFDRRANGTVDSNGAGVVLLRRLDEALAGGAAVRALMRGSAGNNDGGGGRGTTAHNVDGQAAVIQEALAVAGVPADSIRFVETHGTGTPLGDPVEIAALSRAFRAATDRRGFCAIASLKSNMGHLFAAAGVAGLIKAVLAIEHGEIPASLHVREPNPELGLEESPFFVQTALGPWPAGGGRRRAGVSSFGIGGTNAHVVIEQAPESLPSEPSGRSWHLLALSAASRDALEDSGRRLAEHLETEPEPGLADVAHTLHVGRRQLEHRRMLVTRSPGEAAAVLARSAGPGLRDRRRRSEGQPVVFLFPGGGAQYRGMAGELLATEPVFRREIDRCAELFRPYLDQDLRSALRPSGTPLRQPRLALAALFAVEVALARLWLDLGVQPATMLGHSLGEYAAAHLAGVLSLEHAVKVVARRGELFERMAAGGGMLSVPLPEDELRPLLGEHLDLAAVNGPANCVAAGPAAALDELAAILEARGLEARPLALDAGAAHSRRVEPLLDDFRDTLEECRLEPPRDRYLSSVAGDWIEPREVCDPSYWVRHLRQTVRFGSALDRLLGTGSRILLEVGPGTTLSGLAGRHPAFGAEDLALSSLPRAGDDETDAAHWLTAAGRLWLAGVPIRLSGLYRGERRRRLELPTYPFTRRRCWIEPGRSAPRRAPRLGKRAAQGEWFYHPTWHQTPPLPRVSSPPGRWLLFRHPGAAGEALGERLAREGHRLHQVLPASAAGGDEPARDRSWLEVGDDRGYRQLVTGLQSSGAWPDTVVWAWSLPPAAAAAGHAELLELGFFGLLRLVRALSGRATEATWPRLIVLASGLADVTGHESLSPAMAPILGITKVLPQEHAGAVCRTLDLDPPPDGGDALRRWTDVLIAELHGGSEPWVAHRRGRRWRPELTPWRLPAATGSGPGPFRLGGVYLLTGGLGHVGQALADHLARRCGARLALLSRTALPPRERWSDLAASGDGLAAERAGGLLRLEELGAEVLPLVADVADPVALDRALAEIEDRFGRLDGVIHAAGLTGREHYGTLHETEPAQAAAMLRPKVDGVIELARALAGRELDFCLLVSSLASHLGGIGYAAYAASNLFLDAFAEQMARRGGQRWISFGSEHWRFAERTGQRTFGEKIDRLSMTPEEGGRVFETILATETGPRIVVSTGDLALRTERWIGLDGHRPAGPSRRHDRPALETPYQAPEGALESRLAELWSELLGVGQIGRHDSFFELGGHSLLATQVLTRLRSSEHVELSLRRFFTATTIAELAELIRAERSAATPKPGHDEDDEDLEQIRI